MELKNIAPLENFDWDSYEKGAVESQTSKEEQEKAYDETLNQVNEHEVVEGTVIAIDKRQAVVDIGYKSDGIIPISDFRQERPASSFAQKGACNESMGARQQSP